MAGAEIRFWLIAQQREGVFGSAWGGRTGANDSKGRNQWEKLLGRPTGTYYRTLLGRVIWWGWWGKAAGPSQRQTVHSKKLNKSHCLSEGGLRSCVWLTKGRPLDFLKWGLCGEGGRRRGAPETSGLTSQGHLGLAVDKGLVPGSPKPPLLSVP